MASPWLLAAVAAVLVPRLVGALRRARRRRHRPRSLLLAEGLERERREGKPPLGPWARPRDLELELEVEVVDSVRRARARLGIAVAGAIGAGLGAIASLLN